MLSLLCLCSASIQPFLRHKHARVNFVLPPLGEIEQIVPTVVHLDVEAPDPPGIPSDATFIINNITNDANATS